MRTLIIALAMILTAGTAAAQEGEAVDPVALASVLIQNGHHDRAAAVLAEVDPLDPTLDKAQLASLRGIVALKLGRPLEAAGFLEASIALQEGDTRNLSLLLAQARFSAGLFQGAVDALDDAGQVADAIPETHLMRIQAHWSDGAPEKAWSAAQRGAKLHPGHSALARHRVMLLVDLGLFETAAVEGRGFLERPQATAADFVAIAEVLRKARRFEEARGLLEGAHLKHPDDLAVAVLLARTCADVDMPLAAAHLYQRAALRDPKYAVEAAETYRRAGWVENALRMNALVPDPRTRARQRLGLLVELERFDAATALAPRLSRLGLLRDESVRYALAYALFKIQRYDKAEAQLGGISDPDIFDQASELRRVMAICRQDPEACG